MRKEPLRKKGTIFVNGFVESGRVYLTSGFQPPYDGELGKQIRISAEGQAYATGGCYSEDTQILTNKGWKYFKDLEGDELFYTLNPETKEVELHPATAYIKYYYEGEMIHFKSETMDILVTPDHNMAVAGYGPKIFEKIKLIKAEEIFEKYSIRNLKFLRNNTEEKLEQFSPEEIKKVQYSGYVYCVEVPNHIIYVKRNKSPLWCGNSIQHIFLNE